MLCKFHSWTCWYPNLLNFVSPGLQIGFFLERAGRDYIIFERENMAGILLNDNGTCISIRTTLKPQLDKPKLGYLGRCAKKGEEVSVAAVQRREARKQQQTNNIDESKVIPESGKNLCFKCSQTFFRSSPQAFPFFLSPVFRAALPTDGLQLGLLEAKKRK